MPRTPPLENRSGKAIEEMTIPIKEANKPRIKCLYILAPDNDNK